MFHKFNSQEERKKYGGTSYIEIQYCELKPSFKINEIVSVNHIKHWNDKSLYIQLDDIEEFVDLYKEIFDNGVYNNLTEGYIDEYGINYYSKDKVEIIKNKLQVIKPKDFEILLSWLEDSKKYNGIYILGI